ncbi:hypothetical protein AB1H94_07865 [Pseudomonas fulva]|uniref:hypothetical protein n=1 Tax=Pseudomonas fulva TaxID=47880 RepID=UPI000CE9A959|nr:hypothetical protein [Pseudomonas fulva]AVF54969.1 hypothetical protein AL527_07205 [Pseudomonas fulva]
MIQTFQHNALGLIFDIRQMDAETAILLQSTALERMNANIEGMEKGRHLEALFSFVIDDGATTFENDPFLAQVSLNGEIPDYDCLFAGRYEEIALLYSRVLDVNYGFLANADKGMFLGASSQSTNEERHPASISAAAQKLSQSQILYQVLMCDKNLATLHEMQTIYCLQDLYKLYELVAFERHVSEVYRKQAETQS